MRVDLFLVYIVVVPDSNEKNRVNVLMLLSIISQRSVVIVYLWLC